MSPPERLQALEQLGESGHWAVEYIVQLTLEIVRLQRELEAARAQISQQEEQLQELQRQAHPSVSQGGLGFWLEQAIDFLPGDKPVF
jgi:predicted  nucleic acid-binding Zn-ribbon protein